MAADTATGVRRSQILEVAATMLADHGLRTSMREIADATGLLKGSLYHHFDSKDAILVELVGRYYADLNLIGEAALHRLERPNARTVVGNIERLSTDIANCAVAHRAALQMTFYDSPSSLPELVELLNNPPALINEAVLRTLTSARDFGAIRPEVDVITLADRLFQTMVTVGLDVVRHKASSERVAGVLCRIILNGLARRPPRYSTLDKSKALEAASSAVRSWGDLSSDTDDVTVEADRMFTAARAEFGRRGYEITTVREIAAAAGVSLGKLTRVAGSKPEMLASIMRSFGSRLTAGYSGVLNADSSPIEKMDALSWVHINAVKHFPDEYKIQQAWMRQSPPDTPNPGFAFANRMRRLKGLLSEGIDSGVIRNEETSLEVLSRCVINVLWIPQSIVESMDPPDALTVARDTWLRGVRKR